MQRVILFLVLLLALQTSAFATWSVIAVDRATGKVVISSATCVNNDDEFLKGVQAVVVPGVGVAACQAGVDGTHQNQTIVFQELQKGTDPAKIIEMLSQDPGFQGRQYGIVDLQGRMAGHSGLTNGYVTQDIHGQVPGTEIFYSIQGNILRPGNVVPNAVKAFIANKGALTDRVMAAMDAADAAGGDSRCVCPTEKTDIPCTAKTSHIAYILAAEKTDSIGPADSPFNHNNGKYSLYITVAQPTLPDQGGVKRDPGPGKIKAGENLNPVKTLRMRYDAWRKNQPATYK